MKDISSKVVREEIKITHAKVERIQYVQHSYVCPQCREDGESTIEKAPVPPTNTPQHGIYLCCSLYHVSEMHELSAVLPAR